MALAHRPKHPAGKPLRFLLKRAERGSWSTVVYFLFFVFVSANQNFHSTQPYSQLDFESRNL